MNDNPMPNQSMKSEKSVQSSGWITTNPSSWASTRGLSNTPNGPNRAPLAWAGVRHQFREDKDGEKEEEGGAGEVDDKCGTSGHCNQAVLITCLHLSHEMGLRDVGQYAWTIPSMKDPMGSMMKIMKQYSQQLRGSSKHATLDCRSAPDPSKLVIQHHLQRARQQAGNNNYVAVIYNGHGIQEPPTEQGELWCYDRSFDECLQSGGGPSEYIPIMLFDVLAWAGSSTCYVWDVSYSGRFIKAAVIEAEEIDKQFKAAAVQNPQWAEIQTPVYAKRQIHFASCGPNQSLPRINGMPDDLFTACLTNPLRIALLFHNLQTFPLTKGDGTTSSSYIPKSSEYMNLLWENMSLNLKDRLEYELNSIIHTIAWQTLNNGIEYSKLFGKSGDLVNNLSTGFILSQRVLGSYRINPESIPNIPSSTGHTLWTTWDLILDNFFEQLPKYFDEGIISFEWEKKLKLVSFMKDQLESITTLGQGQIISLHDTSSNSDGNGIDKNINNNGRKNIMTPSLSRLPIICAAAMTKQFRIQACKALDSCLSILDIQGLSHAVQGGSLDVAVKLLLLEDEQIKNYIISIWSSLVRYDIAVMSLVKEGLNSDNENLSSLPSVKFFLNALEENLIKDVEDAKQEDERISLIIQTSAVLSSIANFISNSGNGDGNGDGNGNGISKKSPRVVIKSLSMSGIMLRSNNELVKQWGALLIAEVLGSLDQLDSSSEDNKDKDKDKNLIEGLKSNLIQMINSNTVETRATAIYALSRWITNPSHLEDKPNKEQIENELNSYMGVVEILLSYCEGEGSPLVRRELARMFIRVLEVSDEYTGLAFWILILEEAIEDLPNKRKDVEMEITNIGKSIGIKEEQLNLLRILQKLIKAVKVFKFDPDFNVIEIVNKPLKYMFKALREDKGKKDDNWNKISQIVFADSKEDNSRMKWTEDLLDIVMKSGRRGSERWFNEDGSSPDKIIESEKDKKQDGKSKRKRLNNDLFEKSKFGLKSYLAADKKLDTMPGKVMPSQEGDSRERTWTLRHRILEDSLVIAEQQVGIPWKWHIKDISAPDPWTTMTFHSFHNTIMSCNGDHDLLLWDWSTSRKIGHVQLDLPKDTAITSARFVNELHEQTVILAEISNGDIHILAGPQDSSRIKPIANFRALNLSHKLFDNVEVDRKLLTSWYRSSGLLCVGGYSDKINIWDCPAERCIQVLETSSSVPVTTLITEPVSGNLIFSGLSNGEMKLFDLRQSTKKKALISWKSDQCDFSSFYGKMTKDAKEKQAIIKIGVVLGESKNLYSACANGIINSYDLRQLSKPINSTLSHSNGISKASFQAHSGLLSTVSNLQNTTNPSSTSTNDIVNDLSNMNLFSNPKSTSKVSANFSLFRTSLGSIENITTDTIEFPLDNEIENQNQIKNYKPFTVFHPLRPFLSIGFGKSYYLRGCGIGMGDDTDSGSYSFLRAQGG